MMSNKQVILTCQQLPEHSSRMRGSPVEKRGASHSAGTPFPFFRNNSASESVPRKEYRRLSRMRSGRVPGQAG